MCFDHCNKDPYQAFGLYLADDCGCIPWVEYPDSYTYAGADSCDNACPGDASAACGGFASSSLTFFASVYESVNSGESDGRMNVTQDDQVHLPPTWYTCPTASDCVDHLACQALASPKIRYTTNRDGASPPGPPSTRQETLGSGYIHDPPSHQTEHKQCLLLCT